MMMESTYDTPNSLVLLHCIQFLLTYIQVEQSRGNRDYSFELNKIVVAVGNWLLTVTN